MRTNSYTPLWGKHNRSLKANNQLYFYVIFSPKSAKYSTETLTQQPSANIGLLELIKYFKVIDG